MTNMIHDGFNAACEVVDFEIWQKAPFCGAKKIHIFHVCEGQEMESHHLDLGQFIVNGSFHMEKWEKAVEVASEAWDGSPWFVGLTLPLTIDQPKLLGGPQKSIGVLCCERISTRSSQLDVTTTAHVPLGWSLLPSNSPIYGLFVPLRKLVTPQG